MVTLVLTGIIALLVAIFYVVACLIVLLIALAGACGIIGVVIIGAIVLIIALSPFIIIEDYIYKNIKKKEVK